MGNVRSRVPHVNEPHEGQAAAGMSASIRDVAAAAGVSLGTVSNVLNGRGRVAPATAARVRAAIDQIGFVRNDAARQLRSGSSRTVGLIVLEAGNPFFADVARGAEQRAREAGMFVLLANSDDSVERELGATALFEEQRVAGVIVSPAGADLAHLLRLVERGTQVVLLERATDTDLPSVTVDNIAGGRIAAEHLLSLGHRRITFVGGPTSLLQVSDRQAGAREAVAVADGHGQLEVCTTTALTVEEGRHAAAVVLASAPSRRPTAVLAANDLLAIGLLQGFLAAGTRVPDDIAIVGYDDIDFAASTEVPLTSVRQPSRLIGATAVDLLLQRLDDPLMAIARRRFQPELVVRASTAQAQQ